VKIWFLRVSKADGDLWSSYLYQHQIIRIFLFFLALISVLCQYVYIYTLLVYESSSFQTFGRNFSALQTRKFLFASYRMYEPGDHACSSHVTTNVAI
jgi:hypothetical protein